jgi:tetratricopeptide (TPR) repeat protein
MRRLTIALTLLLANCLTRSAAESRSPSDDAIRFLEDRTAKDPEDFVALNQLTERYFQKLRETGDLTWLKKARRTAEASVTVMPERNLSGVAALAHAQLASHRFRDAVETARRVVAIQPNESFARALLGDALLEFGELDDARNGYDEMRRLEPDSVQTQARLARLALMSGDFDAAQKEFTKALQVAKKLSTEVPETIAWCEVQRGELAFSRGNWDAAEKDYRAALEEFPDYFAAVDHLAELQGARGKFDEAIAMYQRLSERLPRPEFQQAVGDLLVLAGKPEQAKPWHDRALAGYKHSVAEREAMFIHHLANFFADVREDASEAVEFARRDLELRHTSAAHEMLAWSLFRSGDFSAATAEMEKALASGGLNAHLAYHAGMIFSAADQFARGQNFLRQTVQINPHYHAFHVHR